MSKKGVTAPAGTGEDAPDPITPVHAQTYVPSAAVSGLKKAGS